MPPSQSINLSTKEMDKPEWGTLAPVAHPTETYNNRTLIWTREEIQFLRKTIPNPLIATCMIQEVLPWRTQNAISLKASRLGLKITEEYL